MFENIDSEGPAARQVITRHDLVQSARLLGSRYEFDGYAPDEHEPILGGTFHTHALQPGLILHAAHTRDLHSLRTRNTQLYPGVKLVVVVVDGSTDFAFGCRRFELGPQGGSLASRTQGALINLVESDAFSRCWQRGRHERKVSLTLSPEWLAAHDLADLPGVGPFLNTHLAGQTWLLTSQAIELARQILQLGTPETSLERLRLRARCMELVAEAFGAAFAPAGAKDGWRTKDRQRLKRLDDLLHSTEAAALSTSELARQVGCNPTSLQALARRAWGCTVGDRARAIRLEQARTSLAGGVAIADVALAAGYRSASNFSTAFKQHHGITPRQARLPIHAWPAPP